MTATSAASPATAYSTAATTGTTSPVAQQSLGQDDFLKLLATQLSAQDPMQPMDDTQFISQMANFSSLQQMQALNQKFDGYTSAQQAASAPQYLGKQVTVYDPITSQPVSGIVSTVSTYKGSTTITIDGSDFPLSSITSVSIPSATPVAPTSPSAVPTSAN